jgi:hypothetical protein
MTLSVVFIFSVVALHGMFQFPRLSTLISLTQCSHRQGYAPVLRIEREPRRRLFSLEPCLSSCGESSTVALPTIVTSLFHRPYPFPFVIEAWTGPRETSKSASYELSCFAKDAQVVHPHRVASRTVYYRTQWHTEF